MLLLSTDAPPADDRCADLARLTIDRAVIHRAELSGDVCKVTGAAHPVPGSDIRFALHLPAPDRWSGRYYQIGNGGFAGAIHVPTLDEGARRGDAIAATDTGHRGNGFDASWADGSPVALADYGWRSIKATRDAAQALVAAYYQRPPAHRYFMGCSNGGRMALMAAARWPEDWDGVIAGAPANPWTAQLRRFDRIQSSLRAPGGFLSPADLAQVRSVARAACPTGTLRDGVAQRPDACRPDWARLACRPAAGRQCLSRGQLSTLTRIVDAGYQPAAMDVADWQRWIANADRTSPSQLTFAVQSQRHLFGQFRAGQLVAELDVRPADLQGFRARGGRILSYFGWSDAVIAPGLGRDWYRSVGRATHGNGALTDFYRLFMIPGMRHCQGGVGRVNFGQSLDSPASADRPGQDIRATLEAWVERGSAPTTLIGYDHEPSRP